jgi:hypothetical protein
LVGETGYLKEAHGVLLRYSVLLLSKVGRFPVMLIYSGYDTGSIGAQHTLQNNVTFSVDLDKTLVEPGYAVIGVNARVMGCSEGISSASSQQSTEKMGLHAVEFVSAQPWSKYLEVWSQPLTKLATKYRMSCSVRCVARWRCTR